MKYAILALLVLSGCHPGGYVDLSDLKPGECIFNSGNTYKVLLSGEGVVKVEDWKCETSYKHGEYYRVDCLDMFKECK